METQEVRVFKAVHDEGGFRKAADRLHITQSAVSQTISNLEKKLGTLIIERGNPISLTESGLRLLQYAELALQEESNVRDDISNILQGVRSTLHIAMSGTVSQVFGNDLLEDYCDSNPLTRLQVDVTPSRKIISSVIADTMELGFGPFQQQMPQLLETIPLFEETRKLVINSSHKQLQALRDEPENIIQKIPLMVSHLEDPGNRPAIDRLRNSFGTIWEVSQLPLRLHMVSKNLGMCYVDDRILNTNPQCANFVELQGLDFSPMQLTFGLYFKRGRTLSTGAKQFIDICRSYDFGA